MFEPVSEVYFAGESYWVPLGTVSLSSFRRNARSEARPLGRGASAVTEAAAQVSAVSANGGASRRSERLLLDLTGLFFRAGERYSMKQPIRKPI